MQQEHETRVLLAEAALQHVPVSANTPNRDYLQKGHGQPLVHRGTSSDDGPGIATMLYDGLKDKDCKVQ